MKNEFVLAFNEVLEEKQLPKEIILQAIESAMVSAYRRAVNASSAQHVEAKVDPETGKVAIFAEKEVVDNVEDPRTEVAIPEARRYNPEAEAGMMVVVESTPRDFGRVAAQTARQVIQQRIRDAERQAQMAYYQKQLGRNHQRRRASDQCAGPDNRNGYAGRRFHGSQGYHPGRTIPHP
jgi:transcription termination/antitermination protein NusA